MDSKDNPVYLRSLLLAVEDFQRAFAAFMALHQANTSFGRGLLPAVFPLETSSPEVIAQAVSVVGRAAGRASAAPELTNTYFGVQGAGLIDPIAAWHSITKPKPVLEPDDIESACSQLLGRLDGLLLKAEADAPPTIGAASMHPLVWGAARRLWRDRHFRQAVAAASESVISNVKSLVGRNDLSETALWQEVFSDRPPMVGRPRLRWPGLASNRDVKAMNDGLRQFAPGVQMTVRNAAAHGLDEMLEQQALEQLAILSQLAHWVDECELQVVDQ